MVTAAQLRKLAKLHRDAYPAHRERPFRSIVITWTGHRERSEATEGVDGGQFFEPVSFRREAPLSWSL
jgi:hypothetical protein